MFLIFLLYALFASVLVIEKTCLQYTQPLFLVGSRMVLAGIVILLYQYFFYPNKFKIKYNHVWKIFLLATFNIYLTNTLEIWSLGRMTAFKTCFFYSLSPFVAALFSYIIFSEVLSRNKWIGLFIGCLGIVPLLLEKFFIEGAIGQHSWPEVAMIVAVVCNVFGWILLKHLICDANCPSLVANGLSMSIGGIMSLFHSFLIEDWNSSPVSNYFNFLVCFTLILIISNLICYNLYGILLKKFSATFISFAGFTTPLFTAFLGWIFLGEVVTWTFYLSSSIVFFGLFLFSKEELQEDIFFQSRRVLVKES